MNLTTEQAAAAELITEWIASDRQEFTLAGLAGTGKTTMISLMISEGKISPAMTLTPTGKAAQVLREKGVNAETIHSAIKLFIEEKWNVGRQKVEPKFEDAVKATVGAGDLVIVDEASMVDKKLADDLRATGVRIIWVGDHGQLEPVGEDPGLMENADVKLEQIMRQASGSPILRLALKARTGATLRSLRTEAYKGQVEFYGRQQAEGIAQVCDDRGFDQIIAWTNKERRAINAAVREQRGNGGDIPEPGERIVILKNDKSLGLYNGQHWEMVEVSDHAGGTFFGSIECCSTGRVIEDLVFWDKTFGRELSREDLDNRPRRVVEADFAYCITAHKAQGSEWPAVLVVDPWKSQGMERWRYTSVTRASTMLGVIG